MSEAFTDREAPKPDRAPEAPADFNQLLDLAKIYLGNALGPLLNQSEKTNDNEQPRQEIRLDLTQLIELVKLGFGASYSSAMSAQSQNMMIMRKHLLRSEAEMLTGLLAMVEAEEKRVDEKMAEPEKKSSGPQKIIID